MVPALHHGMLLVGLPNKCKYVTGVDELRGLSFYGSTTIKGSNGSRFPNKAELMGCHY